MKKFSLILTVLAMVLGMTQCRKPVIEPTTPVIPGGTVTETITFGTGDDGAKVDFSDLTSPKWEASDKIVVYANNGTWTRCGELSLTSEPGNNSGTFSGEVSMPAGYTEVKFFHYGSDVVFDGNKYSVDLADQTNGISGVVIMNSVIYPKQDNGQYEGQLSPAVAAMNLNVAAWTTGAVAMENNNAKTVINTNITVDNAGNITTAPGTGKISYDAKSHIILLPPVGSSAQSDAQFTLKRGNQEARIKYDESLVVAGKQLTADKVQYYDYNAKNFTNTQEGSGANEILIQPVSTEVPFTLTAVVRNTTKGEDYYDLQKAINEATSGNNLQLLSSVIPLEWVTVDKTLSLDLNGYSITPENGFASDGLLVVKRNGTLTINGNGTINSGNVMCAIKMTQNSTEGADGDFATLVVNGGTITGFNYGISGNGNRHNTRVTINGGTISSTAPTENAEGSIGIYQPQDGELYINGGTITGVNAGVEVRSGSFTMTGGTVTGTVCPTSTAPNGNGGAVRGAGIAVSQHTTGHDINVAINGGVVNGYTAFYQCTPQGAPVGTIAMSITGGTFNATNGGIDPIYSEDKHSFVSGGTFNVEPYILYVAEGKMAAKNGNVWNIVDAQYWAAASSFASKNDNDKTITIETAEQLAKLAADGDQWIGYTITLTADIDLFGKIWNPIRLSHNTGLTFKGGNHKVSNLRAKAMTGVYRNAGLFGNAYCSTIEDLIIDNAMVVGRNQVAAIAGSGLSAKITGCQVENARISTVVWEPTSGNPDDGDKAGAICGYLSAERSAWVRSCVVTNCKISGYRDCGGLVGFSNGSSSSLTSEISGNTVNNVTLYNYQTPNYKNYETDAQFDFGEVVGEKVSYTTFTNNTPTNVDIKRIK